MNQEKIGIFIKKIRKEEHLSQSDFAKKYNVTAQAVSKWENGKSIPDIGILKQICESHNMLLDDLLEAKPMKKKKTIIIFFLIIIALASTFIIYEVSTHKKFEFKTISATCKEFTLYGSIAYNESKSSIYISNINYCGKKSLPKYTKITCTLYEKNKDVTKELKTFTYNGKKDITLDEYLSQISFKVNNYDKVCKTYQNNSLYLEIDATTKDGENMLHKIPLKLESTCDTK